MYFRIYSFALASSDTPPPLFAKFSMTFILAPVYWGSERDKLALIEELIEWTPPPFSTALLLKSIKVLFC